MSLTTFSKFYYGHTIDSTNSSIDFNEGSGPLLAVLNRGDYSLTNFLAEIKRAMEAVGTNTYTVSVDRATRKITISTGSNFSLLVSSGTHLGTSAFGLMGFTGSDRTGASTYQGNAGSGFEYKPQAILFDHIAPENWVDKNDAVVNSSASGRVQAVSFGTVRYAQLNIKLATNKTVSANQVGIENQVNGLDNLRAFMEYGITKAEFEFIPDRDTPSSFYRVLLDRTEDAKDGTSFKLKELKGGPGYFESGKLVLRVIT